MCGVSPSIFACFSYARFAKTGVPCISVCIAFDTRGVYIELYRPVST